MKTKNSGKSNDQQHGASKDENSSQEELNMDELFDLQGGIDEKLQGNCGLGCFTGAVFNESIGDKDIKSE